ncbi:unnamed protein product [Symbiodinium sp. CCMP2456]|nr:unnamed protein product [Symbiodinium sp. CCMP2456]
MTAPTFWALALLSCATLCYPAEGARLSAKLNIHSEWPVFQVMVKGTTAKGFANLSDPVRESVRGILGDVYGAAPVVEGLAQAGKLLQLANASAQYQPCAPEIQEVAESFQRVLNQMIVLHQEAVAISMKGLRSYYIALNIFEDQFDWHDGKFDPKYDFERKGVYSTMIFESLKGCVDLAQELLLNATAMQKKLELLVPKALKATRAANDAFADQARIKAAEKKAAEAAKQGKAVEMPQGDKAEVQRQMKVLEPLIQDMARVKTSFHHALNFWKFAGNHADYLKSAHTLEPGFFDLFHSKIDGDKLKYDMLNWFALGRVNYLALQSFMVPDVVQQTERLISDEGLRPLEMPPRTTDWSD